MKRSLQNIFIHNKTRWTLGILFLIVAWVPTQSVAQTKEYANSQENGRNRATILLGALSGGYSSTNGTTVANVTNPSNAVDGNETTHATMMAKNISILLFDYSGEAWLQMNYANPINANTTTYIKIDKPTATGFNLDLLELVGGLLGLLDENIIIPEVYDGANMVSSSNVYSTMARDADGNLYLAVTSSEAYTGVRLKLRSQSNLLGLSLGGGLELNVYDAFHYTDAPTCGSPLHTYYEDSGLNIGLLDFNNQNLENAIDDDVDTYSLVKSGALLGVSVTGSMAQSFNFITESTETSTLNIKLALGSGGLINTDLLGSIQVLLYDANGQEVYNQALQSSLLNNTDILAILGSGAPATLTFAPGRAFSRAEVKLNSVVGVNLLGNGVRIYDVQRYDDIGTCTNPEIAALPPATDDPFETASCASGLIDFENVDFAQRAVDGNNESYATLFADAGNLLVSGPTAGFIEMDLGQTVPANKTTYVRINYDEDVLDRLVGGSLGKLVGDLANNLLLGNQYFEVEAKDGTNTVLTRSSSNAFEGTSNGAVTLVQDNIGRYYIAITPDAAYNRVRITNHVVALLSTGKKASLDVYNACFEIGTDPCLAPNFTSYRGGGVGLSVGNISSVGVKNAYRAISENSSEYSEINLGVAGLLAHVYQTIYFSQPSQAGDKVKIKIALEPSSALSLDVLGRYRIKFFNGNTQVGNNETLESGLINNLDLLALFGSGGIVELEYEPNGIFDRVEIGAESIASVNVAAEPLRLYSVERYGDTCPLTKTPFPFEVPSCSTTLVDAHNADNVQNLFDDDFDSYATLKSGAGILFSLGNQYEGYVEMGYNQPMSAGTTSYIRIDFDDGVLDGLLGGSLGNVVSGLLDNLILGDHFFRVDVKDANSNIIHTASSNAASAGGDDAIRVVQDAAGRYYIAVTPTADYQSVRITDATNSLLGLLAEPNTMNVYGMCTDMVSDACFGPFATSFEHSGLSLSVNDLGSAGVTNGSYAINGNTSNYSQISNGTLGLGASTKQWIFFNSVSKADDVALVKFKTQAGIVDLDILGGLEIKAYLGNEEVAQLEFQNGIVNGVNVLNLLNNGELIELPFQPGAPYDRISVGIKTLVEASVFPPIELYSVERCYSLASSQIVSWKSYTIDNDATKTSVVGSEEIEYTIHVKNIGSQDLSGFTISDELPEGLTWISGGTHNGGIVSFSSIGSLEENDTMSFTFKAKVAEDLTDIEEIKNIAIVRLNNSNEEIESYPPIDNTIPDNPDTTKDPGTVIPVTSVYDFTVIKNGVSDGQSSNQAEVGDEITYSITVENTGNQKLTNISVKDIIQNDISTEITIVDAGGGVVNGDEIDFTINELNVGDTVSFTVITEVIAIPTSEEISNKVEVGYTTPDNVDVEKEVEFIMTSICIDITASELEVISDTQEAICGGASVVLTANMTAGAPTLGNPVFKWYKNQDLSDTPQQGESITVNPTSTTIYYVTIEDTGYCFSGNPAEIEVSVLPSATANDILIDAPTEVCQNIEVTFNASLDPNAQTITNPIFKWYTDENLTELIYEGEEFSILASADLVGTHTLYATVEGDGVCPNTIGTAAEHTITVKPLPELTINGSQAFSVVQGVSFNLPSVTASNPNTTMQWYNEENNPIDGTLPQELNTPGTYTYTVIADLDGCTVVESFIVTVFDSDFCPPALERVYATEDGGWATTFLGGVDNRANALDGNPKTHSTIVTGLGLLGLGTTWQNIEFDHVVPAGTPVTVKLGKEYSGLMLAGGLSVVGLDENGNSIGVIKSVAGGLLDLLVADNVLEFTFVPSNISGPKPYKGVRVSQGALLSVGQISKVYGAYYTKLGALDCDPIDANTNKDVLDLLHGVEDIGLGVASATASVSNPWNAVDNDLDTYAMMSRGVAVANRAFLNVVFKQQAMPGDELHIVTEVPGNPILSLELIKGYKIQRFLGDQPVGPELDNNSGVLRLKLLGLGYANKYKIIVTPYDEPYDRVKISYGSVVGVLGDFTKIYDVSIVPEIDIPESPTELCLGDNLVLNPTDICTIYDVYTTETGMDKWQVVNEFEFEMPEDLTAGLHTLYVQAIRNGCPIGERQEIKVEINDIPILDDIKIDNQTFAFDTTIEVSPGDVVEVVPTIDWGDSNKQEIVWEMENPETPGEWIAIPFAETEVDGTIKFTIPDFGEVTLPGNTVIDIRNTEIPIRLFLESNKGCQTIEDGLILKIDGKSQLIVNPNITNKLKN